MARLGFTQKEAPFPKMACEPAVYGEWVFGSTALGASFKAPSQSNHQDTVFERGALTQLHRHTVKTPDPR